MRRLSYSVVLCHDGVLDAGDAWDGCENNRFSTKFINICRAAGG